jgi:hypothetical protein
MYGAAEGGGGRGIAAACMCMRVVRQQRKSPLRVMHFTHCHTRTSHRIPGDHATRFPFNCTLDQVGGGCGMDWQVGAIQSASIRFNGRINVAGP